MIYTPSEEDPYLEYKPKYQIFHELMAKRIRKVLLVSSYYDNFILEEDGRLSDQIFEEFHNLNLRTLPQIRRVSSAKEALELIKVKKFDLIITMRRLGEIDPFSFGLSVKAIYEVPVILLLNNSADLHYLPDKSKRSGIDRIFVWNGDSTIFIAIIKLLEDQMNVEQDTKKGLVRVIIVVEDSIRFYSLYLPLIYSEIMKQTHRIITEGVNDFQHLMQMRARPKILLAETYEEAMAYYNKYRDFIMGIISDCEFPINGVDNKDAGFIFVKEIRSKNPTLPIVLQSNNIENKKRADELKAFFIRKNSLRLLHDLRVFMLNYLGFGDFIFRLPTGKEVGRARSILDFRKVVEHVPEESLIYHGSNDHFSGWLAARGEFKISQKIKPKKISEFASVEELRRFLINTIDEILREKSRSVVNDFSRANYYPETNFLRLRPGSLGGKGRGIAFLMFMLSSFLDSREFEGVEIRVPQTVVIGTDEFDKFMDENKLYDVILKDLTDEEIRELFVKAKLSHRLRDDLRFLLENGWNEPITVRSSSVLEDSQYQPFAGIFETYMLPNNADLESNLNNVCTAIKLVYASSFLCQARSYSQSIGQSLDEAKMAVILQKTVGKEYPSGRFYPDFSGVASSYNFYPVGYLKPDDKIAFIALGLGKAIVDGYLVYRFSPKYPHVNFYSTADELLKNSQKEFFAIDMTKKTFNINEKDPFLVKVDIYDAKDDGTLAEIADTFDYNDNIVRPGYSEGAPVITFSKQLQYNTVPLSAVISKILSLGEKSMGSPVEIEFAGLLNSKKNSENEFYLLQIRPFTIHEELANINIEALGNKDLLVFSSTVSGNRAINDIKDVVYVIPERFDKMHTLEMIPEIDKINETLVNEKRPYILIGPGRWGSSDRFLGIPAKWNNISGAQVIIETDLENYKVEHSQGSHFFQNIITSNIGYFNIRLNASKDFIDWKWLDTVPKIVTEMKYVRHVRAKEPFVVKIDGTKRQGVIIKPGKEKT